MKGRPYPSAIAAGRRIVANMAAEIDKLKRQRTEEALKHAKELENNPHRRRTD